MIIMCWQARSRPPSLTTRNLFHSIILSRYAMLWSSACFSQSDGKSVNKYLQPPQFFTKEAPFHMDVIRWILTKSMDICQVKHKLTIILRKPFYILWVAPRNMTFVEVNMWSVLVSKTAFMDIIVERHNSLRLYSKVTLHILWQVTETE